MENLVGYARKEAIRAMKNAAPISPASSTRTASPFLLGQFNQTTQSQNMKSAILALAALATGAQASSWVFWYCHTFDDFCLEGGVCTGDQNYWVQYSEPNGK